MTSEEIRKIKHHTYGHTDCILVEIAAQLADLNEFLRDNTKSINVDLSFDTIPVRIRE